MIVVAIIGILAAVAIPAYTDYMKRAKVSEAIQLLGGLKTPLIEHMDTYGGGHPFSWLCSMCHSDGPPIGKWIDGKTGGKYTTNLTVTEGPNGAAITIGFKMDDPVLSPHVFALGYDPSRNMWVCDKTVGTTVPDKYPYSPTYSKIR